MAEVLAHFKLSLVHPSVAFGHGEDPGPKVRHRYRIIASGVWDGKALKALCKQNNIKQLRISRRHFPHAPADILKQLKVKEGGNKHLCCYRDSNQQMMWVLGQHISA